MNKNIIIGGIAVVVIAVIAFMFMGGDTPQGLIDEAVEKITECNEAAKAGDADAIAECEKPDPEFDNRWDAVMEGLSDEEKADWEEKAAKAVLDALGFGGLEDLLEE